MEQIKENREANLAAIIERLQEKVIITESRADAYIRMQHGQMNSQMPRHQRLNQSLLWVHKAPKPMGRVSRGSMALVGTATWLKNESRT